MNLYKYSENDDGSCVIAVKAILTKSDIGRIQDGAIEGGELDEHLTIQQVMQFLDKNPKILRKIIYLGEAETEVGDDVFDIFNNLRTQGKL